MPTNWPDTDGFKWTLLSNVARLESGHTPSRKHPEYWGGNVPWIGIKDATGNHGGTLYSTQQYTNALGIANSSARVLPKNTVCLSRTASVGYVVVMGCPMATSQDFVNWVCSEQLDYRYLKYILLGEHESMLRFASGTTHQTIYFPEAKAFHVLLPQIGQQRKIADILQSLDDRITLLRETNVTLEAIAQALFKSWFVDFDPVRAKAEGRQPEGMSATIAALFPDSFEESELGLVPKGWHIGTVSDLGEVICGKTPPTSQPKNYGDDVPFITIPDMHGRLVVTSTGRSLSRAGADSQKKKYLPAGSVCVSCIATPGLVVRVSSEAQTNQQINSVVPFEKWGKSFPLFLLRRIGDAVRVSGSGGSVFHNLSKSGFESLKVLLVHQELAQRFDEAVEPLVAQIMENQLQAQTLTQLRDTLLPRLISGQLRLPEAEALVAEVAS
nr:restriction endonuclease subunit S [Pseudomonas alcaligenes]